MKQIVTEAIVLRRINYQEADRIITFLTPDRGKITAMARGARRAKSKLAGSIELFGVTQITFLPGKGEINTLISARLIKNFGNIVKDLKRTELGYGILKLVDKNIEDEGDPSIYNLVSSGFGFLNDQSISLDLTKLYFSLNFLNLMGHAPNLDVDREVGSYVFDFSKMQFQGDEEGIFDKNHIKVLRLSLVNEPDKLAKIADLDKVLSNLVGIIQRMLIETGYSPL